MKNKPIIIAMTGASGAPYALRLIQRLGLQHISMHLLISDAARVVLDKESGLLLSKDLEQTGQELAKHLEIDSKLLNCWGKDNWMSPVASGSSHIEQMVVVPCSMGTLARIATGISSNLIERAADVVLKEKKKLIIIPRETPLSEIHLQHMLTLTKMGVMCIPAMPGFYHKPQSVEDMVDFIVDRILDHLGVADDLMLRWGKQD